MATTKGNKSKTASVKTAASSSVKEEPKKSVKKEEQKKIAAKPEAKKITTAKEPKKIATAKAPEKIAAKPEPKKIATKETVKLETKPAAVKKAVTKKEAKKEEKPATKAVKKETAKKETKTTTKAVVKEPAKKVVKSTESKKPAKKAIAKKPISNKKAEVYASFSIDDCIIKLQGMDIHHTYEDYARFLMDETDLTTLEKNIIEGNHIADKDFTYEKDGVDIDLVLVTLQKIADTMDIKALDYKDMKKEMNASVKTKVVDDAEKNAAEYLKEFKLSEKLLMLGQRKHITSAEEVSKLIGSDVDKYIEHFFDLAYNILPSWQYDDVKFYEDFAFAILSQFTDLYEKYQLRILLDVADLYIKHGDFQHGDECYGYILRDNQIKDYIYYRFATVYENIDFNKAKGLAYESLQYVDGRYTYYQDLLEIINK